MRRPEIERSDAAFAGLPEPVSAASRGIGGRDAAGPNSRIKSFVLWAVGARVWVAPIRLFTTTLLGSARWVRMGLLRRDLRMRPRGRAKERITFREAKA